MMVGRPRRRSGPRSPRPWTSSSRAHADVGGDVVSAGGTGTYDLHDRVTEIQAGSYALMDTDYATLGLPFRQALFLETTVISVSPKWAVCDAGLKSLGMDHGNPTHRRRHGLVLLRRAHHLRARPRARRSPNVGDRVRVIPAHVDPTMALHERAHLVRDDQVLETWPIDLRGW